MSPAPPPPRRRWPWVVVGLALAGLAVVVALNVANARHRLTRERLDAARRLWQQAGVKDYDCQVEVEGRTRGTYRVQVRGGRVVEATQNGQPFDRPGQADYWTMEGLLSVVLEDDLATDAKPDQPAVFTRAEFDPGDGHLVRYLRSSRNQRIQMTVTLTRLEGR